MNPNSFTEIKKQVGGTAQYPASMYLFEHEGAMWAFNGYWVTPASRVAPLLERFNLDASKPGAFEVNGTVRRANGDNAGNPVIPDMGKHLDPVLYPVALCPVLVAGRQALVLSPDTPGAYLAAYQAVDDGSYLGLVATRLEWLDSAYCRLTEEDHYYGPVRYMTTGPTERNRAVAIIADLIRRVSPVSHGTGPDGEPTRSGGETENLGPRVTGIIASVKLGS
jgi:hypothetical protein